MLKKLLSIVLILACTAVFAEDETVVIKAKGEFAKELKELMEKYEKSGAINGSVEIIDEKTLKQENSPIEQAIQEQIKIDSKNPVQNKKDIYNQYFSDDPVVKKEYGNVAEGKELYDKRCYKCHGENADKNSYSAPRKLKTLAKEDIIDQLKSYNRDSSYGSSSTGLIMRTQATMLTDAQMRSVATYIETLKNKE